MVKKKRDEVLFSANLSYNRQDVLHLLKNLYIKDKDNAPAFGGEACLKEIICEVYIC